MGSMTVTSGASVAQVRAVRRPDRSDSQADSAGSIPVTRSDVKAQVSGHARRGSLARRPLVDLHGPFSGPELRFRRAVAGLVPAGLGNLYVGVNPLVIGESAPGASC